MSDHSSVALGRQLRSLGGRDDLFPQTPDIAADVGILIRSDESTLNPIRETRRFGSILDRPLRVAAIVALAVLAALAIALAVPTSRTTIADFFGIEGIRIEFGQDDEQDTPGTPTSIGGSLLLGERTTLEAAMKTAPFDVVVPSDPMIGEPEEIYLNQRSGVTVAGMLWQASDELPEIGLTGVGMLLLEIESDDDDVIFVKKAIGGGEFNTAMINNAPGYWIENGVLTVEPMEGLMLDLLEPEMRRSGNVLIWSDGEVTYRLETSLPMEDAVQIAESLEPVEASGNP